MFFAIGSINTRQRWTKTTANNDYAPLSPHYHNTSSLPFDDHYNNHYNSQTIEVGVIYWGPLTKTWDPFKGLFLKSFFWNKPL